MDIAGPPCKRPRTDDWEGKPPKVMKRSSVWYPDGNIILQADHTHYRVHKSVLSGQSSVFNDMLMVGNAPKDEMFDGCPVVKLDDSSKSVSHLLKAMYDRSMIHTRDLVDVEMVASLVRLGRKYDVKRLYQDAIECLLEEFPCQYDEWKSSRDDWRRIDTYDGAVLDLIRLARAENLPFLLPQLFHDALEFHDLEELAQGYKDVEGLPYQDFVTVMAAQKQLQDAGMKYLGPWVLSKAPNVPKCPRTASHNCSRYRAAYKVNEVIAASFTDFLTEPWEDEWAKNLCDTCKVGFKEYYNKGREELWSKLPSFFGLPPWEELLKENPLRDSDA